jgi:hypothetical protein
VGNREDEMEPSRHTTSRYYCIFIAIHPLFDIDGLSLNYSTLAYFIPLYISRHFHYFLFCMAKEKKTPKRPMTFRFTPETVRKLGTAAVQEGMSMTVYVELALKAQFRKNGIT